MNVDDQIAARQKLIERFEAVIEHYNDRYYESANMITKIAFVIVFIAHQLRQGMRLFKWKSYVTRMGGSDAFYFNRPCDSD